MLRPIEFGELGKSDLIPQAIIRKPISSFEKLGFRLVHDTDALDDFEGTAFSLDELRFALLHHRGTPADETTVYLTRDFGHDVDKITNTIRRILVAFELSRDFLVWQRKDDPDL